MKDQINTIREAYYEAAKLIGYERETGRLYWLDDERNQRNLRGTSAGSKYQDGYTYIRFRGKTLCAHRVAWVIEHGVLPEQQIDHINMDRSDNRTYNLRLATYAANNQNRKAQSNNTSGFKGVTLHKASGKYQAKIRANKKTRSLGYFRTALEASQAYQAAAKEHHGEFARFN